MVACDFDVLTGAHCKEEGANEQFTKRFVWGGWVWQFVEFPENWSDHSCLWNGGGVWVGVASKLACKMNASLFSLSSLGSGLSASLKVCAKVALTDSDLSFGWFLVLYLPSQTAWAKAARILWHWALDRLSRIGSCWYPIHVRYRLKRSQARACFALDPLTTASCMADSVASKSAMKSSLPARSVSLNQTGPVPGQMKI